MYSYSGAIYKNDFINKTWLTFCCYTLIYKKVIEVCQASIINAKFVGGETANMNFLRDIDFLIF